jgi:ABC-type Co2+ transport system permease subunit
MTKKDKDDKDYKPISPKMSYGWGWFFLAGLFVQLMNKNRNGISEQTGNYIIIVGLILLLSFYFFLRNRLLKTERFSRQVILASLISGVISLVVMSLTMSFIMGLFAYGH